jgi:hypothetical protein
MLDLARVASAVDSRASRDPMGTFLGLFAKGK